MPVVKNANTCIHNNYLFMKFTRQRVTGPSLLSPLQCRNNQNEGNKCLKIPLSGINLTSLGMLL